MKLAPAGGAGLSGWDGWNIDDDDAKKISVPAARILKRHPALAVAIIERSDVLALIMGAGAVFVPRFLIYRELKRSGLLAARELQQPPPPVSGMESVPQPPSRDATITPNGKPAVNYGDLVARLRKNEA